MSAGLVTPTRSEEVSEVSLTWETVIALMSEGEGWGRVIRI